MKYKDKTKMPCEENINVFTRLGNFVLGFLKWMFASTEFAEGWNEAGGIDGITLAFRGKSPGGIKAYKSANEAYEHEIAKQRVLGDVGEERSLQKPNPFMF